jgi:hypothetical protein
MHSLKPSVQAGIFFQFLQGFFHDAGSAGIRCQLYARTIFFYPVGEIRGKEPKLTSPAFELEQYSLYGFLTCIKTFYGRAIPKSVRLGWEIDSETALRVVRITKAFTGDANRVKGQTFCFQASEGMAGIKPVAIILLFFFEGYTVKQGFQRVARM